MSTTMKILNLHLLKFLELRAKICKSFSVVQPFTVLSPSISADSSGSSFTKSTRFGAGAFGTLRLQSPHDPTFPP